MLSPILNPKQSQYCAKYIVKNIFLQWKFLYCESNYTEGSSSDPNYKYTYTDSDNVSEPNRRQAIVLTNDDQV